MVCKNLICVAKLNIFAVKKVSVYDRIHVRQNLKKHLMGRKVLEPYPIFFGMYKWRSTFKIQNFITFLPTICFNYFLPFCFVQAEKRYRQR